MGIKIASSIIFLGTGGDSYVVGRQLRSSGGFILQVGENQFHIDPGPGALNRAIETGVNLRANNAIFASHNHMNHCNDINAVINAMTYNGFDKKGVLIANNTVVNGAEGHEPVLSKYYRDFLERYIVVKPGQRVGVNEVEVLALKAKHSDPNTIGFKFFTPLFTLSYSSDTKYSAELVDEYKNSNLLILNVVGQKKEDSAENLCIDDAIKIIRRVEPKLAIIQHFGISLFKPDPLYEIREIQKQTGVQTIAAKDGMIINPISYSVDKGQRTLQAYPRKDIPKVEIREIESVEEKEMPEEKDENLNVFVEDSKED